MSETRLPVPIYAVYWRIPAKIVRTPDGGLMTWKLNPDTGGWQPANDILDEILFATTSTEISHIYAKDEFIDTVERARAQHLKGDGPVFALYETIAALIDTARRENRQPTPVEQAMIRGLRRQTYALFETELVRRGDPGADTEATRSAGELTDENQAERE